MLRFLWLLLRERKVINGVCSFGHGPHQASDTACSLPRCSTSFWLAHRLPILGWYLISVRTKHSLMRAIAIRITALDTKHLEVRCCSRMAMGDEWLENESGRAINQSTKEARTLPLRQNWHYNMVGHVKLIAIAERQRREFHSSSTYCTCPRKICGPRWQFATTMILSTSLHISQDSTTRHGLHGILYDGLKKKREQGLNNPRPCFPIFRRNPGCYFWMLVTSACLLEYLNLRNIPWTLYNFQHCRT